MKMRLDGRFQKQAIAAFGRHRFEVGIFDRSRHRNAGSSIKGLAGGPARTVGRGSSGVTISDVSESVRAQTGINYLTKPFQGAGKNRDIVRFANEALKFMLGHTKNDNRVRNLLQAIVRNPITRGDYGSNSAVTAARKGFNRLMIDTGQLFRAIKARIIRRRT